MEGIGEARVHDVSQVLQRSDGDDAEWIGAGVEEAGHQLVSEHALPPVSVDRAAAELVLDGHLLTARVCVPANRIERLNGVRAAEVRVQLRPAYGRRIL